MSDPLEVCQEEMALPSDFIGLLPSSKEGERERGRVKGRGNPLSFSSLVRPPRPAIEGREEDIRRPGDRARIIPDIEQNLAQAVRWLYDNVHELERSLDILRDAKLLTEGNAERLYSATVLKPRLQAQFPQTALNVQDLVGVLVQPQKAGIRSVSSLPDVTVAQDGELVYFNQIVWRFNGKRSVAPGRWEVLTTAAVMLQDSHANRLANFPAVDYPVGTLFWETDRKVLYQRGLDGSAGEAWVHTLGVMEGTVIASDQRPGDLGTDSEDLTFLFYATDLTLTYQWDGSGDWTYYSGHGIIEQTITEDTLIADPNAGAPPDVIPAKAPVDYHILQDGVGGWAVTWDAVFKGVTALTVGTLSSKLNIVNFRAMSSSQLMMDGNFGDITV